MTTSNYVTSAIERLIKERGEPSKKGSIPFSKVSISVEEVEAVARVLTGTNNSEGNYWLAAGPETEAFENEFSDYISPEGEHYYCIFTNSCTSALKMAYKILHEQGIYKVSTPENTFCATYAAAREMGLDTVPYGESKYRVNVHYAGIKDETPCVIEDSAHRIEPNDPLIGTIRCYSFYATKNMTTGSGGMFVTNDKDIYERARLFWRDGISTSTHDRLAKGTWDYRVEVASGGYDGNDIAAAIGRVQLRKLPEFTKRRNEIRDRYNDAFGQQWMGNHLVPYFVSEESRIRELISFLRDRGIASGYHYPGTGWLGVSLPIYPDLTNEEQEYIISAVLEWQNAH